MSALPPVSPSPSKSTIERLFDEIQNEEMLREEQEANEAQTKIDDEEASVLEDQMRLPIVGPDRAYVLGAFRQLQRAEGMALPQLAAVMRGRLVKNNAGKMINSLKELANLLRALGL